MSRTTAAIADVAEVVLAAARELNRLDAQAGDGDLGVTMSVGARAVLAVLPDLQDAPLADVLRTCGATMAREAPSTSGTLVATGLLAAARAAGDGGDAPDAGARTVARLLAAARDGIAERGKAELGDKTMLDALAPAAEAAERGTSAQEALREAAGAADAGARATVSMTPRHGRAGWLAERSAGHEDAGARLVAVVLAALAEGVSGSPAARRDA